MRSPRPAPLRTRRAVSVGAVSGMGAVLAHGFAGGAAPPAWLAGLAVLVGVAAALPLTRARIDLAGLAAAALASQAVFHLGFTVAATPSHDSGASMLLAHTIATALTLLVARASEDAWWRLADSTRAFLTRTFGLPTPTACAPALRRGAAPHPRAGLRAARAHASPRRTRGPPAAIRPRLLLS